MFFRCSRMLSVSPPSPMEVKKLMLKRMLRGVSCMQVPKSASYSKKGMVHVCCCCDTWEGS